MITLFDWESLTGIGPKCLPGICTANVTVTAKCASPPLAGKMKRPQLAILGADVDHPTRPRRRGLDEAASGSRPQWGTARLPATTGRVESIQLVISRADVDHTPRHRRRGMVDGVSSGGGPQRGATRLPATTGRVEGIQF